MGLIWAIYDNKKRRLVKELEEAKRILKNAYQNDFLTGLTKRSEFTEDLEKLIETETPCT